MSDNINLFEGDDKNIYLKTLLYNSKSWFGKERLFTKNLVLTKTSFVLAFTSI